MWALWRSWSVLLHKFVKLSLRSLFFIFKELAWIHTVYLICKFLITQVLNTALRVLHLILHNIPIRLIHILHLLLLNPLLPNHIKRILALRLHLLSALPTIQSPLLQLRIFALRLSSHPRHKLRIHIRLLQIRRKLLYKFLSLFRWVKLCGSILNLCIIVTSIVIYLVLATYLVLRLR